MLLLRKQDEHCTMSEKTGGLSIRVTWASCPISLDLILAYLISVMLFKSKNLSFMH